RTGSRSLRRRFSARRIWHSLPTRRQLQRASRDTFRHHATVPLLFLPRRVAQALLPVPPRYSAGTCTWMCEFSLCLKTFHSSGGVLPGNLLFLRSSELCSATFLNTKTRQFALAISPVPTLQFRRQSRSRY